MLNLPVELPSSLKNLNNTRREDAETSSLDASSSETAPFLLPPSDVKSKDGPIALEGEDKLAPRVHQTTNPIDLSPPGYSPSDASTSISGPAATAPQYSRDYIDDEALALENAARSLEIAAANSEDPAVRRTLLKKAERLRDKKNDAIWFGRNEGGVFRKIGGGVVLIVTIPIFLTGAVLEGTGAMLNASGVMVREIGVGLKTVHTWTVDKLRLY
ncbi:hypothetical protein CC1G_11137 [Coprinopsis cinerea okayama7|uniref:Uncharacterized protein n=1 Tax=Coprinopsis cinerea (strain Okayama-7 / 130 / ATCC MYA-4618 / FGSC 9003) TaxID=240176 RepID=A8N4S2_COPC7|nr:hypothetical protein CC1G_11137 [Coprinopsis cinerea okayama7\|eukprot:XP_001829867.2 hypothetical protein CC1G_11137 [Coprinopsis cinerea okayama7\